MKKGIKLSAMLLVAGTTLLSSGCGCSLKGDKLNESTKALYSDYLAYYNDEAKDYSATYKYTVTDVNNVTTITEYTIARDLENNAYYFTTTINDNKITQKIYTDGGKIYSVLNDDSQHPVELSDTNVYYAYLASVYYPIFDGNYDFYKTIPFNACSSEGDKNAVSGIWKAYSTDLKCKAKKKLFGKNITYTLSYPMSVVEATDMEITVNPNNEIIKVKDNRTTTTTGNKVIEYSISYDDVNIK